MTAPPREVWVVMPVGLAFNTESDAEANAFNDRTVHRYILAKPKREVLAYAIARGKKGARAFWSPAGWGSLSVATRWRPDRRPNDSYATSTDTGGTVVAIVRKAGGT